MTKATYLSRLTADDMNSGKPYRVEVSFGTFSVSPKKLPNGGCYYSAYKRRKDKLYKVYVGKRGTIDHHTILKACMALAIKAGVI